jgi:hypothetical protein
VAVQMRLLLASPRLASINFLPHVRQNMGFYDWSPALLDSFHPYLHGPDNSCWWFWLDFIPRFLCCILCRRGSWQEDSMVMELGIATRGFSLDSDIHSRLRRVRFRSSQRGMAKKVQVGRGPTVFEEGG